MKRLEVDPRAAREAATLLSEDERWRASRFAEAEAQRRFIVARAELRREIGDRLGVSPGDIDFAYGPYGKPRLGGRHASADLHFNLSHSGPALALAFASDRDVGVDIEILREVPEADTIAAQLCSPADWLAYRSLVENRKPHGFLDWWTRREAFVKAHGGGLGGGHPVESKDSGQAEWEVQAFTPGQNLVGAVAYETGHDTGVEALVVRD